MGPRIIDNPQIVPRSKPRSNVFLAALVEVPGGALQVRVRNLSSSGALVEGAVLPKEGGVRLVRGDLHVSGKVAWLGDGHCGLEFDSIIDVPRWLKGIGHQGQHRIDRIVASLHVGEIPKIADPPPQELGQIAEALLAIAERLVGMNGMSIEAGEEILKIDTLARSVQAWSTNMRVM